MNKILIAYFSRADENYVDGQLKYLEKGNTQVVAEKFKVLQVANCLKSKPKSRMRKTIPLVWNKPIKIKWPMFFQN